MFRTKLAAPSMAVGLSAALVAVCALHLASAAEPAKSKVAAPAPAAAPATPTPAASEKVVRDHITKVSQAGWFGQDDPVAKKMWNLKLTKVHTDKITQIGADTSFVCADFDDKSGEKLDLDFFIKAKVGSPDLSIDKIVVHKVGGKPRFMYVKDEKGTWKQVAP